MVFSAGVSSSGSYPSLSFLSASSLAFFSASSKSNALASTFFAPSFVFFAPRMLAFGLLAAPVFRTAVEDTARAAAGCAAAVELSAESADTRGDFGLFVGPLPFALRKGEAVRPMPGVPVREGGLLGRFTEGLSHDEKKSSAGSPAGVFVPDPPALASAASSTITWLGFLPLSAYATLFMYCCSMLTS